MKNYIKLISSLLIIVLMLYGCANNSQINESTKQVSEQTTASSIITESSTQKSTKPRIPTTTTEQKTELSYDIDKIPAFSGEPYITINNNIPNFKKADYTTTSYETYGKLDKLGRCTTCIACIGKDLMPTAERGSIGSVKPTGWQTIKYNSVDGKYLYNRCHLIGYQLTAENANERNLITGTRYLNVDGMLPFEDEVHDYIISSNNHVLYRVTPIFKNNELVARGVQMEAYSVEDNGKGVCFNVYCYNNQPNITIDYKTGNSSTDVEEEIFNEESDKSNYIINTNTKKFHKPNCRYAKDIKKENKKAYYGSRKNLINNGYEACKACNA